MSADRWTRRLLGRMNGTHPWRRYFARIVDTLVNGGIVAAVFSAVLWLLSKHALDEVPWVSRQAGRAVLYEFYFCIFALPVNAVLIGLTGSTLGKWLFGVRIVGRSGEVIGIRRALRRELLVWNWGMGLGLPLILTLAMLFAYRRLKEEDTTVWDHRLGTEVSFRPSGFAQYLLAALGVVLLAALCFGPAWFMRLT